MRNVVSVASVGGIRADLGPGVTLCRTDHRLHWGRNQLPGPDGAVLHIDFTRPYCDRLRGRILDAARAASQVAVDQGVYAATQGPRLETAAEIDRLERDGAHMVGMTGMPEAALAREAGLCYAAIAVVANHAAGRAESCRDPHGRHQRHTAHCARPGTSDHRELVGGHGG